jgi:hypothetical protein
MRSHPSAWPASMVLYMRLLRQVVYAQSPFSLARIDGLFDVRSRPASTVRGDAGTDPSGGATLTGRIRALHFDDFPGARVERERQTLRPRRWRLRGREGFCWFGHLHVLLSNRFVLIEFRRSASRSVLAGYSDCPSPSAYRSNKPTAQACLAKKDPLPRALCL